LERILHHTIRNTEETEMFSEDIQQNKTKC
jgi:hypothetical protein